MNAQGRSNHVQARAAELTDPPEFITDAMVHRFPELKAKRLQWQRWWEAHKEWARALQDTVEELRKKVNSTI
jgi:hypothetical protein